MYEAITGAVIMADLVAGLFFLRFWKKTHDRLFLFFAMAFWILAVNRFTLIFIDEGNEDAHILLYVVRLIAFSLILYAIIDKNRTKKPHN